jgi:hypothetical protein
MAVFLNNNVGVKIATIDLSDHVKSVTITRQFDELETSAMSVTGHTFIKGLESSTIAIEFLNDTATSSVLQTLQTNWGTNAAFSIIQTKGTAVSASNPTYQGLVLVDHTTDINGTVADLGTQSITFTVSGSITVSPSNAW